MPEPDVVAELDAWLREWQDGRWPSVHGRALIQRARHEIVALRKLNDAFRDRLSEMIAEKVAIAQLRPWQIQPEPDTPGLFIQCVNLEQRERIIRALKDESFDE